MKIGPLLVGSLWRKKEEIVNFYPNSTYMYIQPWVRPKLISYLEVKIFLNRSSSTGFQSKSLVDFFPLSPHTVDLVVDIAGCHSGPPQHNTLRIKFFGNTRILLRTCQGFPWGSSKNFDIQSQELLLHGGVEQRSRHAEVKEETDVLKNNVTQFHNEISQWEISRVQIFTAFPAVSTPSQPSSKPFTPKAAR